MTISSPRLGPMKTTSDEPSLRTNNLLSADQKQPIPSCRLERSSSEVTKAVSKPTNKPKIPPGAKKLWMEKPNRGPLGHIITVAYLDHPPVHVGCDVEGVIRQCAEFWTRDANIRFHILSSAADINIRRNADIRITFEDDSEGSWSELGRNANRNGGPTMNLAIGPQLDEKMIRRIVLHEFGHALGFEHEHASPLSKLVFDKAECMKNTGMTDDDFEKNFKGQIGGQYLLASSFDPDSIMMYEIPPEWNLARIYYPLPTNLSETDKAVVKVVYHFGGTSH
ncbi:metalloprotease protein [Fusarium austroafricanum]|uniref:Metalloprotease protein n=1 Tax=Fusarium austroafricanum TaxID=2364996 RepID=A0A8H4KFH5_9HYPO|nr:metalloprotease protein [Fusarium austroafricanum]